MELEVYKKSDFYEDYISSQKEYYERENADAYFAERLAEKDKLIASLQDTNKVLAHNDVRLNKMLAEMDCEMKKLKDSLDTLLKAKTEQIIHEVIQKTLIYGEGFIRVEDAMKLITELRHHKYKRCLAMAKYCHESAMWFEEYGVIKYATFMLRWQKRWLKLAEKFKLNNSTAQ